MCNRTEWYCVICDNISENNVCMDCRDEQEYNHQLRDEAAAM